MGTTRTAKQSRRKLDTSRGVRTRRSKRHGTFFNQFEERWDKREDAVYAIFPREGEDGAGELAGTTGLHLEWKKRAAGLGIWLRKPFWGRGYSGERAAALFELAFSHLDLELVAVSHLPENDQSKRAIEKYIERFGGQYEGTLRNIIVDSDGMVHDAHRHSVSHEEWRAAVVEERPAVVFRE
jgi:ribosomal-protein-alanine N-acetyltransferase